MAPAPAGYSGKPLFQKIGIKEDMRIGVINAPVHFPELMGGAPSVLFDHIQANDTASGGYDIVHLFCIDIATLEAGIQQAFSLAADPGMVWVSWPKKSSKLFIDLTEDMIRTVIKDSGWVDVKVCAVDADWSGLKLLRRRK
ncbi:MAG: DUF3052 domain-containing protein [Pseudomonadota bacterium]